METRANFTLIGAAVVIGAAVFMLFFALMIGSDWRSGYSTYDVVFHGPVRGLTRGGEVRFNGIKVGEVKSLRLDETDADGVVARVQVDADTPVRTDSQARLELVGITGVTLIQLTPGSSGRPRLRGSLGQPPPRISGTQGIIEELMSPENIQAITETLQNVRHVSALLAANDSVVGQSADTARDLSAAARSVQRLADESRSDVSQLTQQAGATLSRADTAISGVNETAETVSTDTLPQMSETARSLRRLSQSLEVLTDQLEQSPARFVAGHPRSAVRVDQ